MTAKALEQALRMTKAFQELDPNMPLAAVRMLLLLASTREELSQTAIAKLLHVGSASCSRYVADYGQGALGKTGLGLVVAQEDPMERRKKIVRLTDEGRKFVIDAIGGSDADLPKR